MPSPSLVRVLRNAIVFLLLAQVSSLIVVASAADSDASKSTATSSSSTVEGSSEESTAPASSTTTTSTGESPPTVDATITGTFGSNGWYVDDVTIEWTISDPETPATGDDGCTTQTVTEDTTGIDFACTATSDGGSTTTTATIARDATAPTDITVAADRAPDHDGWYTSSFTATWTGSDETSGIASCTTTTYDGPDTATGSLPGSCVDAAGNTGADVPFAFKYDATGPTVTGTPDRAADHDGWYTAPVTVTWTSDDADATCDPAETYSGPDTASTSVTGSCADPAGNTGEATFAFKYDASAPEIVLSAPTDGAVYILNEPVEADYACTDLALVSCDGTVADGAALDTASVGSKSFTVEAADEAGNLTSRTVSYTVQYQAAGVACGGVAGHQILQPIRNDGSSVFKGGSTVPAKFRVCDYFGEPVTSNGVVEQFRLTSVGGSDTDQAVPPTNKKEEFRAGDSQWIFNISTKSMQRQEALGFRISLNDGTAIDFGFTLK